MKQNKKASVSLICLPNASFTDNAKAEFSLTPFKLKCQIGGIWMGFYGIAILYYGDSVVPRSETP